ncbi:MAG: hypothetical protein H6657_11400 [Ardenticatenaceae bacterium]|nr:hypothetical protein [Ardenticatenaceae bacterium]
MMKAQSKGLQDGRIHHYTFLDRERPLPTHQILQNWQSDETFRTFFIQLQVDASFDAYFWETPPLTTNRLERPFSTFIGRRDTRLFILKKGEVCLEK